MLAFAAVGERVCAAFGLGTQDFDDLSWANVLMAGCLALFLKASELAGGSCWVDGCTCVGVGLAVSRLRVL